MFNKAVKIPKKLFVFLINVYQALLSPDHSPLFKHRHPHGFCRFYPSCSQYTKEAIEKHGAVKGFGLGFKRIIKCNPWAEPKVDKVT